MDGCRRRSTVNNQLPPRPPPGKLWKSAHLVLGKSRNSVAVDVHHRGRRVPHGVPPHDVTVLAVLVIISVDVRILVIAIVSRSVDVL